MTVTGCCSFAFITTLSGSHVGHGGRGEHGGYGGQDRTGHDRAKLTFKLDFPGNL